MLSFDNFSMGEGEPGISKSLSDIASGLVVNLAGQAAGALQGRASGIINNAPRSSNTAPVPDVTAIAARPSISTFTDSKAFGVSLPILVIGAAAVLYILSKR